MSLKENLIKKREIEKLALRVLASLKPTDTGVKVNRQAMRQLLSWSQYQRRDERDLELWIKPDEKDSEKFYIIVLDGELKCYHTTIQDVAMRKSPTVKEMVSIRNAIKILNDKDVVVTRSSETLQALKNDLISKLDLRVTRKEVEQIAEDGRQALENRYPDGVIEALELLADLLAWKPAPDSITPDHCRIWGKTGRPDSFGPFVLYAPAKGRLVLSEKSLIVKDPETARLLEGLGNGKENAATEGQKVWPKLCDLIMARHRD